MQGERAGTIRADAVGTQETEETSAHLSTFREKKKQKKKVILIFFHLKTTFENSSDH